MTKILSVSVFMLVSVGVCSPQDMTRGNWLLTSCQIAVKAHDDPSFTANKMESFQNGYCLGIIQGVTDASQDVCPGEHVTYVQITRVVLKYLQDHPEQLDQHGSTLVYRALVKAFPCK
jgi:hypothetical protein